MPSRFPYDVITAARASEAKWGCPAPVCLAQSAEESDYGTKLTGRNNPFGIKAKEGEPYSLCLTHEVIEGVRTEVTAKFRDFATLEEAFDAHGKLLATHPAYAAARAAQSDPNAYARALTGHYATDPEYGSKLVAIMMRNDLYRFAAARPFVAPPSATKRAVSMTPAKATTAAVVISAAASTAAASHHGGAAPWIFAGLAAAAAVTFLLLHFRKA